MQGGFQKVAFSRIFGVEKFEEIQNEGLVDETFGDVGVEVG